MVTRLTNPAAKETDATNAGSKIVASPTKALQNIVNNQLSGRLTIKDPNDHSVFWRVYVGNGKVHFASSTMGHTERLSYYLQWYYPELEPLPLEQFQSDYQAICHYWQTGKLSLQNTRKLLLWLTQEAFVQLLALPQAVIQFEKTLGLDPLLLSIPLKQIVLPMRGIINKWVRVRSEISSPFQRPFVKDPQQAAKLLWQNVRDIDFIKALIKVLNQNVCIYEAARYLKTDVLGLAILLQPLVKAGAIGMNPYKAPQTQRRPIIACIDDSKTTQRHIKLILEASGYQVLGLTDPARALTTLARYKPVLVLMDINMPEINGYELCRMLRHSTLLRKIPIVMLTGRDGLIDKLRAQMVGANDYVTKPFAPAQLLNVIHEQLSGTAIEQPASRAS